MSFGVRLKQLRKEKGITQEQLAQILGVERSSIGKYEGKDKVMPSDDIKARIAEYFGVSVDYLLGLNLRQNDNTASNIPEEVKECTQEELRLLVIVHRLNALGMQKVLEYATDLVENDKYTQEASASSAV